VFRSDASELMPGHQDVQRLRQQTVTLAELLTDHTDGWQPPHLGGKAIAQTHCHQHAIMAYDADQALLRVAGVDLGRAGRGLLRAGRELRLRGRALRRVPGLWRAGAAARGARRFGRHCGAGGRVQLPDPDRAG
jgi:hypothetical protein